MLEVCICCPEWSMRTCISTNRAARIGRASLRARVLDAGNAKFAPIYDAKLPIKAKIDAIVRKVYGADGADYLPAAEKAITYLETHGMGETPVCIAKTQYSLTDDPTRLGKPIGFRITINEVTGSAGAGFVVAKAGDIMTMPGLPKVPAAEGMSIDADGEISGLS